MERKPIKGSSNVVSAGYKDGLAVVEFKNGSVYESNGISQSEWDAFEKTFDDDKASTGSHYHRFLKDKGWKKL